MASAITILVLFCTLDGLILSLSGCALVALGLSLELPAVPLMLAAPLLMAAMARLSWKLTAPLWAMLVNPEELVADKTVATDRVAAAPLLNI